MDTDSNYLSFSHDKPFPNLVKPHLREEWKANKYLWFPRDDNGDVARYDARTQGLFKEEWRGGEMIALAAKNNYCSDGVDPEHSTKFSCKGVQDRKANEEILCANAYVAVVTHQTSMKAENCGFRIDKHSQTIVTYTQQKAAIGYYYDKRQVLEDGISTTPLRI